MTLGKIALALKKSAQPCLYINRQVSWRLETAAKQGNTTLSSALQREGGAEKPLLLIHTQRVLLRH